MGIVESTGWEITGSSGITGKIETPIINVSAGASYLRLPIQHSETGKSCMLHGAGIGLGGGVSIGLPVVSISGSLDQFPADGLGFIAKGTAGIDRPYQKHDFGGELLVVSLSAGKQISGTLGGVLWLNRPVEACMLELSCSSEDMVTISRNALMLATGQATAGTGGAGYVLAKRMIKSIKAAGAFAAMNVETQLLGAGADMFVYKVVNSI